MNERDFETFFDRQFPQLSLGEAVPKHLEVYEGRRPRKLLGALQKHGDLILSKKVDTRFKRLEISYPLQVDGAAVRLELGEFGNFSSTPKVYETHGHQRAWVYLDLCVEGEDPCLPLSLVRAEDGRSIETGVLGLRSFLWRPST
jgi:hypothetical protein